MYIGIDPGKTGAVAILDDNGNYINVLDFGQEGLMSALIGYAPVVKFAYLEKSIRCLGRASFPLSASEKISGGGRAFLVL